MIANIIYTSKHGNTKALANSIGRVFDITPINIKEEHVLPPTDLLFVGVGIYGGKPEQCLLDYIDNLRAATIKGAAIFSSCATGKDQTELVVNLLRSKGIEVFSKHFICKGQFLFISMGHPDSKDIRKCTQFALDVKNAING